MSHSYNTQILNAVWQLILADLNDSLCVRWQDCSGFATKEELDDLVKLGYFEMIRGNYKLTDLGLSFVDD